MAKRGKIVAGVVAALLLGIALSTVVGARAARTHYESDLARALAEAKRLHMPLTIGEVLSPEPPTEQNAGWIYLQAGNLLNHVLADQQSAIETAMVRNPKPFEVVEGVAALQTVEPVFSLVDSARGKPCVFPHKWSDGPEVSFPELSRMKSIVRDLCFKARIEEQSGDWRASIETLRLAEKVARDAGTDPVMTSLFVRVSCETIVYNELYRLIDREPHNPVFLELVVGFTNQAAPLPNARFFFGGEIALNMWLLDNWNVLDADLDGNPNQPPPQVSQRLIAHVPGARDEAKALVLTAWEATWRNLPSDPNDWDQVANAITATKKVVASDHSAFSHIYELFGPWENQPDLVLAVEAHRRVLRAVTAVLIQRNQTGALPATLPSSLGVDAIDPFNHEPLRFVKAGSGFKVYSVGPDRVDNGGKERDPSQNEDQQYDIVLRVH